MSSIFPHPDLSNYLLKKYNKSLIPEPSENFEIVRYVSNLFAKPHIILQKTRFLAYVSEVGESFRPIIPRWLVNSAYGVSIGYVGIDTIIHTWNVNKLLKDKLNRDYENKTFIDKAYLDNLNQIKFQTFVNFMDKSIWHTFASMVLPMYAVHGVVDTADWYLKSLLQHKNIKKIIIMAKGNVNSIPKYASYSSVLFGLLCIPWIIHPLDHATDFVMDNSIRKLYGHMLVNIDSFEMH
jgi:fission process protein 1